MAITALTTSHVTSMQPGSPQPQKGPKGQGLGTHFCIPSTSYIRAQRYLITETQDK